MFISLLSSATMSVPEQMGKWASHKMIEQQVLGHK
jgi:hypothetical protein